MKSKFALSAIVTGFALAPLPAAADVLYPFRLSYQQCTQTKAVEVEPVHKTCAEERARIVAAAAPLIWKYFSYDPVAAVRSFEDSLLRQEQHAEWLAEHGQLFPPGALKYIACLTEKAFADERYRTGKFLRGRPIEISCRPLYQEAQAGIGNDRTSKKTKVRLRAVKTDFANLGEAPIEAADFGFLGL